ncbi:unnamed protein product [Cuscuta campestris]|uniref:CBM-cenC domain-containing protein n=1 Tax=Cuscuta campestris TaxID=132261 RepID=A0A484NF52_9ASTE|nr:unnamed protein product [Cuscuta campestris]
MGDSSTAIATSSNNNNNIILNHDFSQGLQKWTPNHCKAHVVRLPAPDGGGAGGASACFHAVLTNRKEGWQGLEQDITARITPGTAYSVRACVSVSGELPGGHTTSVQATLRLHTRNSPTLYLHIGRKIVSPYYWGTLEGTFFVSTAPDKVEFFLEGPPQGVDILVKSVTLLDCTLWINSDADIEAGNRHGNNNNNNIVFNYDFSQGLHMWNPNGCKAHAVVKDSGTTFAAVTNRKQSWHGLEQDITNRVVQGLSYNVRARVRVSVNGVGTIDVQIALRLEYQNLEAKHYLIER